MKSNFSWEDETGRSNRQYWLEKGKGGGERGGGSLKEERLTEEIAVPTFKRRLIRGGEIEGLRRKPRQGVPQKNQ